MRNRFLSQKGRLAFYKAMLSTLIYRFNTGGSMGFCTLQIENSNILELVTLPKRNFLTALPELYRHKPIDNCIYWYPLNDFKSRYDILRLTILEMEEEASHLKFWQKIKWNLHKT